MLYLCFIIIHTSALPYHGQTVNMTKQEALNAIEKFMDSELAKKKAGRADYIGRGTKAYKLAIEAVTTGEKVRTTSKFRMSQQRHLYATTGILWGAGIPTTIGNDAPRGGAAGNFVIVNLEG